MTEQNPAEAGQEQQVRFGWNTPLIDQPPERTQRSPQDLVPFLEWHFGRREIRVLEIGVFKGGLTAALRNSALRIVEYVGVDPYLGTGGDSYLGWYWSSRQQADDLYGEMQRKFNDWGFSLERSLSGDYLKNLAAVRFFDFIYVDGDHRFLPALWDCCLALGRLAEDGVLGIDDYANSDTPEVTLAVNEFLRLNRPCIRRAAMIEESFCNTDKFLPIIQRSALLQATGRGDRLEVKLPAKKPDRRRAIRDAILDFNLRKLILSGMKLARH